MKPVAMLLLVVPVQSDSNSKEDKIRSRVSGSSYGDNYERTFGKKEELN